jgi:hypothetical protein
MSGSDVSLSLVDKILSQVESVNVSDVVKESKILSEKYTTTTAPSSPDPIDYLSSSYRKYSFN